MARVKLEKVCKVYDGEITAVQDVDIEVEDGELVVLVGPSGCGKSTTLRMIAGLETISAGRLLIGDVVVNDLPPKERNIAMVFQNYALYPHMTAYDNMAFGLKLRKYDNEEIDHRVRQAARILSIEPILDRRPKQLSGGQRQRVAVGRAIVRKPQVFLLDEPLSNLDAKLRAQMRTEIATIHRRLGTTMIYVTHDQVEAMTMGDRIVVLRDGRIQQIDTPRALYNRPVNKFVAGFIGSPSMNFVRGRIVRRDDLYFRAAGDAFMLPLHETMQEHFRSHEGKSIILGVRPEDIYTAESAPPPDATAGIRLLLDVTEPMGNESTVYASVQDHAFVARVAPQPLPEPGQSIRLAFDLTRLHFFDTETEEAIGMPETAAAA